MNFHKKLQQDFVFHFFLNFYYSLFILFFCSLFFFSTPMCTQLRVGVQRATRLQLVGLFNQAPQFCTQLFQLNIFSVSCIQLDSSQYLFSSVITIVDEWVKKDIPCINFQVKIQVTSSRFFGGYYFFVTSIF